MFDFQKMTMVGTEDDFELDDEDDKKLPKLMITPFGPYEVNDSMNPFKRFNFFLGNTNFDMTQEVSDIIEETPGVEVLEIFTRYRFVIAVAKLFNPDEVKNLITKSLCGTSFEELVADIEDKSLADEIVKTKIRLSEFDHWVIYILPNGHIETAIGEKRDKNFLGKIELYEESQKLSGGLLITSEES